MQLSDGGSYFVACFCSQNMIFDIKKPLFFFFFVALGLKDLCPNQLSYSLERYDKTHLPISLWSTFGACQSVGMVGEMERSRCELGFRKKSVPLESSYSNWGEYQFILHASTRMCMHTCVWACVHAVCAPRMCVHVRVRVRAHFWGEEGVLVWRGLLRGGPHQTIYIWACNLYVMMLYPLKSGILAWESLVSFSFVPLISYPYV